MPRGGPRPNAGRKPGSQTKKTREVAMRAASEGITPLEVMLGTMRALWKEATAVEGSVDTDIAKAASEVAKDAAPFMHPRLSNIEANVSVTGHEAALDELE